MITLYTYVLDGEDEEEIDTPKEDPVDEETDIEGGELL